MTCIVRDGQARDAVADAGLPVRALPMRIPSRARYGLAAMRVWRAAWKRDADGLSSALDEVASSSRRATAPAIRSGRPSAELLATVSAPVVRSLPAADASLVPLLALRLREALEGTHAEMIVADLPWDCAAATMLRGKLSARVAWFVQSGASPGAGERLAMRDASLVIACSHGVRDARLRSRRDVVVVPNGIEVERITASSGLAHPVLAGLPSDARVIAFVGLVDPAKGLDTLLAAHARLVAADARTHLVIAGPSTPAGERTLERAHARNVHVIGPITDVPALLHRAHAFAFPSLAEGMPLALLEAMYVGVPCVASDIPGIRELGAHGGLVLADPHDLDAWCAALARVLGDASHARALADNARKTVLGAYTFEQNAERFAQALEGGR